MQHPAYDVEGKTIADLSRDLAGGRITAEGLVAAYRARIEAVDRHGPGLHAVLVINPELDAAAAASDRRRRDGKALGPLDGIPILVKDNIETADPMPTTAGSLALAANVTHRDSPLVARLRAAGALILGKTNLSEWANFRSSASISGWSGVGGLTRNPYALDRSACGSSSGSGAAVAASLAPAAIGTETDGSITCPAAMTGLVGLKPTVGLVSRSHVVPISSTQDTPGPMTRSVADAALLISVMSGTDPADPATAEADAHRPPPELSPASWAGKRVGVLRFLAGNSEATDRIFDASLAGLRAAGATLVEITDGPDKDALGNAENLILLTEFKADLASYLAAAAPAVHARSLADLIAFNQAHADRELALFGQDLMIKAQATHGLTDTAYLQARATAHRLAATDGIDRYLAVQHLDVLVAPTGGPAWTIDLVNGDHDTGSASSLPAVAGYPHLTVPMGQVDGLPVGLSLIGPAWSEPRLLSLGAAFEAMQPALPPPHYPPSLDLDETRRALLLPVHRAGQAS